MGAGGGGWEGWPEGAEMEITRWSERQGEGQRAKAGRMRRWREPSCIRRQEMDEKGKRQGLCTCSASNTKFCSHMCAGCRPIRHRRWLYHPTSSCQGVLLLLINILSLLFTYKPDNQQQTCNFPNGITPMVSKVWCWWWSYWWSTIHF